MMYGKAWDRLPIEEKIALMRKELDEDIARWNDIRDNGCSDPHWPDGVNMNLKRNHIIYDLKMLAELEQKPVQVSIFMVLDGSETAVDDVANDPRVPPIVPDTYMAHERSCAYFIDHEPLSSYIKHTP